VSPYNITLIHWIKNWPGTVKKWSCLNVGEMSSTEHLQFKSHTNWGLKCSHWEYIFSLTIYHMNMEIVEVRDRTTNINKTNRILSVFCSELCCTRPATWHMPYYFSCLCIYPKRLLLFYSLRLQEFQSYPQFIMQLKTALCVNADILSLYYEIMLCRC